MINICKRCSRIVVTNNVVISECENCHKKMATPHGPAYKLCLECSTKLNQCRQCRGNLNNK